MVENAYTHLSLAAKLARSSWKHREGNDYSIKGDHEYEILDSPCIAVGIPTTATPTLLSFCTTAQKSASHRTKRTLIIYINLLAFNYPMVFMKHFKVNRLVGRRFYEDHKILSGVRLVKNGHSYLAKTQHP